jgi:hypothetical protein
MSSRIQPRFSVLRTHSETARASELATLGRDDQQIEAAGRLGLEPSVASVRWNAVERDGRTALTAEGTRQD